MSYLSMLLYYFYYLFLPVVCCLSNCFLFVSFLFLRQLCPHSLSSFFFFNDTATTEIYTLSLHDALPIFMFCAFMGLFALYYGLSRRVWRIVRFLKRFRSADAG